MGSPSGAGGDDAAKGRAYVSTVSSRAPGLRVAMVIQRFRPHFSGQGRQVELLCRELVKRGLKPTVITSAYGNPTSEETVDGYRVVRLRADFSPLVDSNRKSRVHGPMFAARTFVTLCSHRAFDLVHVHALTDALYGSWAWARLTRRPVLFEMTLLGVDDAVTALNSPHRFSFLRHAIFRRCDGYAAISSALEQRYHEAGLSRERMRLLPQGVDVKEFSPRSNPTLRRELGIPLDSPILIFVGSLIQRKGIDVVLGTWARIHEAFSDAHLILVGRNTFPSGDPAGSALRDYFSSLSPTTAANVHQLGVQDNVNRLLQIADLFVFPSRREGFGTVMVEAMACGLPCVVADQPGITDSIFDKHGTTGVVIPQEDDDAFVAAVTDILSHRSRAVDMGRAARTRAIEGFNITRIADSYVDFYASLIRDVGARDGA